MLAQTEKQLQALHSGDAGRLHLALDCHSCIQWLLPLLPDFRRQWPGVDLEVESVPGFDAISALLGGQLDLLLTSDVQARGDLHFEPLFAFELVLVMAPDHPSVGSRPSSLRICARGAAGLPGGAGTDGRVQPLLATSRHRARPLQAGGQHLRDAADGRRRPWRRRLPRWACEEFVRQGLLEARPLAEGVRRHMYGAVRAADRDQACLQSLFERIRSKMGDVKAQ